MGGNGKEGLLVGSLFNLHSRKLSCVMVCRSRLQAHQGQ